MAFVKKCPCLRPQIEEDVRVLDYRHCSLTDVPGEVFNFERTLEELYVDSNQIKDLPRELFYCHGIRKLNISDNEIKTIPAAIASLVSLESLDLSKNGVIDIPENIKSCKYLQIVDASVNPLGKLPDGFTQLLNLTQLYLNDTFLDYLPGNFGRLSKLKILEIRENHLKTLPKSFSRLTELEKLDIGHNEFTELPDVIGSLSSLLELWCDHNQITTITPTIGNLKNLMFLDACKNNLLSLPPEIEGCSSLADLHLTTNNLQSLPDSIGKLGNLTTLKADDNQLTAIPDTIGQLESLSELNVSANDLQDLPSALGLLRYLRTFYADENILEYIPAEIGSCSGITVLSLRGNKLTYIPDEIGRIPRLRVLNLSSNSLICLPFSIIKLKELQALWLSENQTRPLIPLQSEHDPSTGRKLLTCYLLPQGPPQDSGDVGGDNDSFHASMWEEERRARQQIHFEFADDSDTDGHLVRQPTPYPKEMREKQRHIQNMALRQSVLTGGKEPRNSHGQDNPAFEESPSMERLSSGQDIRMAEARISKPQSPSLHDPHRLYRYDKEKLAKDKARLQHRQSSSSYHEEDPRQSPMMGRFSSENSSGNSERYSYPMRKEGGVQNGDEDDSGFRKSSQHQVSSLGSTPDIPSMSEERSSSNHQRFTYCSPSELASSLAKQSSNSSRRHGHRSHRHKKLRDYDSDTGYRSDQELIQFRRQQEQMFARLEISAGDSRSEIVPVIPKKGKKDGYSSDLEGYTRRNKPPTYSDSQGQPQMKSAGLPYSPNSKQSQLNQQWGDFSLRNTFNAVRNDELYGDRDRIVASDQQYPPSSPSPFHRGKIVDQSTPMSPSSTRSASNGSGRVGNQQMSHIVADGVPDWKKDLFHAGNQSQADAQRNSQASPQYHSTGSERSSLPPYKPAPPYAASPGQRKLPPTPHRGSPLYAGGSDRQGRSSPLKDCQRMPDIQECNSTAGSRTDLSRSRTEAVRPSGDVDAGTYRISDGSRTNSNYSEIQQESPGGSRSHSADVSRLSSSFRLGDVTYASSKDSGNYSYRDQISSGESPVNHGDDQSSSRNSPMTAVLDRNNARSSPYDYGKDPHTAFDKYDNSFRQPTTVDIPTKYEDIAMFKSSEPPSQVSSSTDSGYGYGHNPFDKGTESHRLPNGTSSRVTPLPEQYNYESPYSSSPSREISQYPRGATPVSHSEVKHQNNNYKDQRGIERFRVTIAKNPGLGFSIAGGLGSYGNPYRAGDMGIFVTKVQSDGPAASSIKPGDKLLEVNGLDFGKIDHDRAVNVLKTTGNNVSLYVERDPS